MTGDELKKLRERAGIHSFELAQLLGVSRDVLRQFENNHRPISSRYELAIRMIMLELALAKNIPQLVDPVTAELIAKAPAVINALRNEQVKRDLGLAA